LAAVLLLVAGCGVPSGGRADIIDPTTELGRLSYFEAPRQIQRDLLTVFAECGTSAEIVTSTAIVEAGPFGGRGRRDFKFSFSQDDWPRKWNPAEYPLHGRCEGNYLWFILWMHLNGDRYKELITVGDTLVSRRGRYILFDVGCNAVPWWSRGRFVTWKPKRQSFVAISKCMNLDDAKSWITAHRYN
jgi:hypothetical protein